MKLKKIRKDHLLLVVFIFIMNLAEYKILYCAENLILVKGYELIDSKLNFQKDSLDFFEKINLLVSKTEENISVDKALFNAALYVINNNIIKSKDILTNDSEEGVLLKDILILNGITENFFTASWIDFSVESDFLKINVMVENLKKKISNKGKLIFGFEKSRNSSSFFIFFIARAAEFELCPIESDKHTVKQIIFKVPEFLEEPIVYIMRPDFKCEEIKPELISKNKYLFNYRFPDIKGVFLFSLTFFNQYERIEYNTFPVFIEHAPVMGWQKIIINNVLKKGIVFSGLQEKYISQRKQDAAAFSFFNKIREKMGLKFFSGESNIIDFAEIHCRDMAENNILSHFSEIRKDLYTRLNQVDFSFSYASEVILRAKSRKKLFQSFFLSPQALFSLMNPIYDHFCISVQFSGSMYYLSSGFFKKHKFLSSTSAAEFLVKLINKERALNFKKNLKEDHFLSNAAIKHCEYVVKQGIPVINRKKGSGSISDDISLVRKEFGKIKLQVWHCYEPSLPEKLFFSDSVFNTFGLGIIHSRSPKLGPVYFCVLILGQRLLK